MQFDTFTYAIFLATVLAAYWASPIRKLRVGLLFVFSILFYATWNPLFVPLLLLSVVVDFNVSRWMVSDPARRRLYLLISVVTNLGVLGYFKYADFLLETWDALLHAAGAEPWDRPASNIILPMGISFYTFQTMSYTIDVYRGHTRPIRSLLTFATYVTFFPQLVAGPIVRSNELVPQLEMLRLPKREDAFWGLTRIAFGLFKKVIVANWLASVAEPVFEEPGEFVGLSHLVAVYAYAFQILFDFAAYCDIGIGSARLLGYRIPENFNRPYLSESITEFWRRWHMTLSTWLRDFLYIPLGGNRHGRARTYSNLMITMLLGGLWHGASWNFVLWGGVHGAALAVHRMLGGRVAEATESPLLRALKIWFTFQLVCLAWVFFRCETLDLALGVLGGLGRMFEDPLLAVAGLLASGPLLWLYGRAADLHDRAVAWVPRRPAEAALYGALAGGLLLGLAAFSGPPAQFIYFQF